MKAKSLTTNILLPMAFMLVCLCHYADAQTNTFPSTGAAGIGTLTPNASSLLEIKSTSKGLLIPRMTKANRNNIVSPATGLLIYQTNASPGFYYFNGSNWKALNSNEAWLLTGNSGTDPANNFIGTTDAQPLKFRVNNQNAGIIDSISKSTAFGFKALNLNTTGYNNTAIGLRLYIQIERAATILPMDIKRSIIIQLAATV